MSSHVAAHPLSLVPYGQLATRKWLLNQGVTKHALDNAVKSKKLKVLTRGVLTRSGIPVEWQGLAASLNRMSGPVYVGGITAFALHGLSHFVSFSNQVRLYSPLPAPPWLNSIESNAQLIWHSTNRLWDIQQLLLADSLKTNDLYEGHWLLASVEQAIFEVLVNVPVSISFEYADSLMQGMVNLSPRRLDAVIKSCHHIKAKRLFFFFADRYAYAWRKKVQPESYDLGKGKRSIVTGGKLHKKYQITVPEGFDGHKQ